MGSGVVFSWDRRNSRIHVNILHNKNAGQSITGRGAPAGNPVAIAIEICKGIFVGLASAILAYQIWTKCKRLPSESASESAKNRKIIPVLTGIVASLILAGVFVLPAGMPRPSGGGGPQGAGGPPPAGGQVGQQPQGQSPAPSASPAG